MLGPIDLRCGGTQRRLGPFRYALLAKRYPSKVADDADERAAISARIAL
jgi:hypothetical protein